MSRAIVAAAVVLLLVGAGWIGHLLTPRERVFRLPAVRAAEPCEAAAPDPPRHCLRVDGRWSCTEVR